MPAVPNHQEWLSYRQSPASLRNQLAEIKQEKQDSPHTPFQIKEKNNKKDSKMGSAEEQKKGRKRVFIPPTPQDVQAYMDQIGVTRFTAVKFCNYYEARAPLAEMERG